MDERNCVVCGNPFLPVGRRLICSASCRNRRAAQQRSPAARAKRQAYAKANKDRNAEYNRRYRAKEKGRASPSEVERLRQRRRRRGQPTRRQHLARLRLRVAAKGTTGGHQLWAQGSCLDCGSQFLASANGQLPRYCSERCNQGASKARRRAAKAGAFVAAVSRQAIYERDDWRCQLCRKKVRRTAVVPHPLAPVLDHIIPLAVGGTHEPSNVQCAHFLCNSIKSHGIGGNGDQLRLIG